MPCWNCARCKQDISEVEICCVVVDPKDVELYYELSRMPVQVWMLLPCGPMHSHAQGPDDG